MSVQAELRRKERELDEAYTQIERAASHGEDISEWETEWLNLLAEYEAIYAAATMPESDGAS
jgi:hypothetical protein